MGKAERHTVTCILNIPCAGRIDCTVSTTLTTLALSHWHYMHSVNIQLQWNLKPIMAPSGWMKFPYTDVCKARHRLNGSR